MSVYDYGDDDDFRDDESMPACPHVSYTEQAGGWLECDDCGHDVTHEINVARRRNRT